MTGARIDLPQGPGFADFADTRPWSSTRMGYFRADTADVEDVLQIQQGSLYPALHRMERRGLIKARWGTSENSRRAKYYELSKMGASNLKCRRMRGRN